MEAGELLELQEDVPEVQTQAFALKFLYEAVKGACVQSVLTSPPLVAQSSAFQRLECIFIAWFLGNGTPIDSKFLNSLMGVPSTDRLKKQEGKELLKKEEPLEINYRINNI